MIDGVASSPGQMILIVDDERSTLRSVRRTLRTNGFRYVETCGDSRQVMQLLAEQPAAVVLLDLMMPYLGGEELLANISESYPQLPVVVVTAEHDVHTAVRCMKLGAVDYLLKPVESEQLVATTSRALEESALRFENERLRDHFFDPADEAPELGDPSAFERILTRDPAMLRLFTYLEAISRGSQPVLICGETGTGKELVADALHRATGRQGPFVAVNVAGLDATMFADTLFGHRRGAFTGAAADRAGMIGKAAGGTLFLDEIGDLSEASQVKLLRLLQEREYLPLGSDEPRPLQARVVAATHRDADALRSDLYYRLRSYRVEIPPLRDRLGDLPLLTEHFAAIAAADLDKSVPTVPRELYRRLESYAFPGNVRELQALVFDAVARLGDGDALSIEPFVNAIGDPLTAPGSTKLGFPYPMPSLAELRSAAIDEALSRAEGDAGAAAAMLDLEDLEAGRSDQPTIYTADELRELERANIVAALEVTCGKISSADGAAALLGMKPTTLSSRIKALAIDR